MLKALLKKQFLELNQFYFSNKKTGKRYSAAGIAGMIILFLFVFATISISVGGGAYVICGPFISAGLDWLYFVIMSLAAMVFGLVGSVFNTYSGLYLSKDNDLLLSLPIKPSKILFVRMIGVYAMGLFYEAMVYIPTVVVYWFFADTRALGVVLPILMFFVIGFVIFVLSCLLGFFVALISSRMKGKTFVSLLLSLLFFGLYYFFYFKASSFISGLIANSADIALTIKTSFYPVYLFGSAFSENIISFLVLSFVVAILVLLTVYVLSKTFIKVATMKVGSKKTVYKGQKLKAGGIENALLGKEFRRFISSTAYMLNCGMAIIFLIIAVVFLIIKCDFIRSFIDSLTIGLPAYSGAEYAIACVLIGLVSGMNCISAPSVSLEGKNIWILRSLPVDPIKILNAKQKLHLITIIPATVLAAVSASVVLRADFIKCLLIILTPCQSVIITSAIGLIFDLRKPSLDWTNEAIPIKQNLSVLFSMLIVFALNAAYFGLFILAKSIMPFEVYGIIALLVLSLTVVLLNSYIAKKGRQWFERIQL